VSKLVKIHGTNEFKEHEPLTAQDLVNRTRIHELAAGIQKFEISENQCINIGPIIPAKKCGRPKYVQMLIKVQLDATVCRHLFTAKSLYMFRASRRPSSGVQKTVTATSGIGHNIGAATFFQSGLIRTGVNEFTAVLIRPRWKKVAVPIL